jgi:MFS family permease
MKKLTIQDFRLLGLAALGGALEFYDFIIFIFFTPVIGKLFFPPGTPDWLSIIQTFGIFGAGYLVRPLGGIALAHFGDLFGRKRIFAFSILLMTLSTIGMALLPTYASVGVAAPILLVLMRLIQGAAIGSEVPGAWIFVAEHVSSYRVGFGCGFLCSGLTLGILLGASVAAAINGLFTADEMLVYAWRIPFFLGGLFGLVAVHLRRWLHETPVFSEMERNHLLVLELPLRVVLRDYTRSIIVSLLLTWFLSAGIVVTTLMTSTLLQQLYGYSAEQSLAATSFGTVFVIVGAIGAGTLIDRVGPKPVFVGGSIFFGLSTFTFYSFAGVSMPVALGLYAVMGLSVGLTGGVPYVMVRAFPARVRFTGVSFSYNVAYAVFGGLTPITVASLLSFSPMAHAYYLLFIAALTLAVGLYLFRTGDRMEFPAGIEERDTLTRQQQ